MRGAFFIGQNQPLEVRAITKPKPVKDQVLVRLQYAALNHRDLWIKQEQATPAQGIMLGSDGSGVIEEVGAEVDPMLVGLEVVINPSLNWGPNPIVQGDSFKILGFPDHGTFSDYLVISKNYIFEKPEHLSLQQAAAVPLAGLTAYRALFSKARLRANEKVLITGIGGGAALWAFQFARAYQARVYVTSSSDEKLQRAKELGAVQGFNYKNPEWTKQALKEAGGFDVVIDSAGGPTFSKVPEIMNPGGRIALFGRTAGNIPDLPTRLLYWKQLSIHGTTMGTRDEFMSMLDFLESRTIQPIVDRVYPLEEINEAFQRMETAHHFGKIIIQLN